MRCTLLLDAEEDVGGQGLGSRPLKLLLASMGRCSAMDVISILCKKRQDVTDLEIVVEADRVDEHPRVYTRASILYIVTGNDIDPKAVERAIELSETRYCPMIAMLREVMPLESNYEIRPV